MYVASCVAGCPYCSAHSCTFAMRRGASPDKVAAALVPDRASFTHGELAAIAVARSLARVPCELTAAERAELVEVYGERNAEWVVVGAVMMGFPSFSHHVTLSRPTAESSALRGRGGESVPPRLATLAAKRY